MEIIAIAAATLKFAGNKTQFRRAEVLKKGAGFKGRKCYFS